MVDGEFTIHLNLLGDFEVLRGDSPVRIPPSGQQLLAGIALCGGRTNRSALSCMLWPNRDTARAVANARGALWRLPVGLRGEIESDRHTLAFNNNWTIDVDLARQLARTVHRQNRPDGLEYDLLCSDILPHWDSFWLIVHRERHRQLRLHALEQVAHALIEDRQPFAAVEVAMEALEAEPLRESAQILLLRAHLGAGNRAAVLRHFEVFRSLLDEELGVGPSKRMLALAAEARGEA